MVELKYRFPAPLMRCGRRSSTWLRGSFYLLLLVVVERVLYEELYKIFPTSITFRDCDDYIPCPWIIPRPLKIVLYLVWVYDKINVRIDQPEPLQNLLMDFGS